MKGQALLRVGSSKDQGLLLNLTEQPPELDKIDIESCPTVYEDGSYSIDFSSDELIANQVQRIDLFSNGRNLGYLNYAVEEEPIKGTVFFIYGPDGVSRGGRHHGQPFLLQCDLVVMTFVVHMNDGEVFELYTEGLLCVSKNTKDVENISQMMNKLTEFEHSALSGGLFAKQLSPLQSLHENWTHHIFRSLESYTNLLGEVIACYRANYPYFRTMGKHTIKKEQTLQSPFKVKAVTINSFQWLMQNSEQMTEIDSSKGVRYRNKHYVPLQISAENNVKSSDVYENQVVLSFINMVLHEAKQIHMRYTETIEQEKHNIEKGESLMAAKGESQSTTQGSSVSGSSASSHSSSDSVANSSTVISNSAESSTMLVDNTKPDTILPPKYKNLVGFKPMKTSNIADAFAAAFAEAAASGTSVEAAVSSSEASIVSGSSLATDSSTTTEVNTPNSALAPQHELNQEEGSTGTSSALLPNKVGATAIAAGDTLASHIATNADPQESPPYSNLALSAAATSTDASAQAQESKLQSEERLVGVTSEASESAGSTVSTSDSVASTHDAATPDEQSNNSNAGSSSSTPTPSHSTETRGAMSFQSALSAGYQTPILAVRTFQFAYCNGMLDKLKQAIDQLSALLHQYLMLFELKVTPLQGMPRKTKTFQEIKPYSQVFVMLLKWFKHGEVEVKQERLTLQVKTLDKLFEYYCLVELLSLLASKGYQPALGDQSAYSYVYQLNNRSFKGNNNDIANTYVLSKQGVTVTVYYQPMISSTDFQNELSLYRTTNPSTQTDFYVPDFVLKFCRDGEESYVIFDAKFSSRKNILGLYFTDVTRKYALEIAVNQPYPVARMVWILQGRVNTSKEELVWRHHNSPLAMQLRQHTSFGVVALNALSENVHEEIWVEMQHCIPWI